MSNTTSETKISGREIRLVARPDGEPSISDFELTTSEVEQPAEEQVLVRNTWMSVDPYMRGRMDEGDTYIPAFGLGEVLDGAAVGTVVASATPSIPIGATVVHFAGWREYALVDAADATVVETSAVPAQAYLGVLGTPGLTAYAAFTQIAPVREGDVVFVSAAAGAVGSTAGQIARQLGASRVIGSAAGPQKAAKLVDDFGFDAALDRRQGAIAEQLAQAAPDGIDVYLDSVGGDHLQAAITAMRNGGRIALIGAISTYNATSPLPGPSNLYDLAIKEVTLRGMLVTSYLHLFPEYIGRAAGWLAEGALRTDETVVDGLTQAPAALIGLLRGENTGKMLVRLAG